MSSSSPSVSAANLARITGSDDLKKLQAEHPKNEWWQFWRWGSPKHCNDEEREEF